MLKDIWKRKIDQLLSHVLQLFHTNVSAAFYNWWWLPQGGPSQFWKIWNLKLQTLYVSVHYTQLDWPSCSGPILKMIYLRISIKNVTSTVLTVFRAQGRRYLINSSSSPSPMLTLNLSSELMNLINSFLSLWLQLTVLCGKNFPLCCRPLPAYETSVDVARENTV